MLDTRAPIFLPCAQGVEPLLAAECRTLLPEGTPIEESRGGVRVTAGPLEAMNLNLHSRLAQRVLWPLRGARYRDEHDLYAAAREVDWPPWITPQQTLRVDTSAFRSPLKSLNFATLRIKDAVCDVMRERTGERPSVDTQRPHLPLMLYLGPEEFMLYVDLSGEALFKRGWRDARGGRVDVKGEAPLKETLAAAMLAAAGWQGREEDGLLLDPCCGAGTIAIEAAQIACGIAPGLQRAFAFEKLAPFRPHLPDWQRMKAQARAAIHQPRVAVHAGDVSFRMTDFAQRNAERAGVAHAIALKTADALQRPAPAARGVIVMNPPYGARLEAKGSARESFEEGNASAFYEGLAAHWKRQYAGWSAWVLTPELKLPGLMRLKESRRVPMFNGAIECRLFRFDMVAGSAR
ncbi:MAG: THUMP domain-containing class I SAM-dependent RNA methyltransferase [Burkholderiaceae bacterium]